MNTVQPVETRKNRFQITKLEDRIAPAAAGLVAVNVGPVTVRDVNIGVAAQALTANSSQIFRQIT